MSGAWQHRRARGGADGDAMTVTSDAVLRIDGMVCGSCTGAVSAALKGAPGVVEGARRSLELSGGISLFSREACRRRRARRLTPLPILTVTPRSTPDSQSPCPWTKSARTCASTPW